MLGIDAELKTNLKGRFSYGLLHMDSPVSVDQQKLTSNSSELTLDTVQKS